MFRGLGFGVAGILQVEAQPRRSYLVGRAPGMCAAAKARSVSTGYSLVAMKYGVQ